MRSHVCSPNNIARYCNNINKQQHHHDAFPRPPRPILVDSISKLGISDRFLPAKIQSLADARLPQQAARVWCCHEKSQQTSRVVSVMFKRKEHTHNMGIFILNWLNMIKSYQINVHRSLVGGVNPISKLLNNLGIIFPKFRDENE